jgi:hypothetical protein
MIVKSKTLNSISILFSSPPLIGDLMPMLNIKRISPVVKKTKIQGKRPKSRFKTYGEGLSE